jgi:peptide/nickel transport system substrate-binding protein
MSPASRSVIGDEHGMLRPMPRAVLAIVAGLLVGCAGEPARERPLEVLIPVEIATLDPRFSTRSFDIKVTRLVHAGLVGLDPSTLSPVPLVAASWRFADDRTLDLTLRSGLRFHSGRALAPDDVCATIAAISNPALGSPHRAVVRAIGSCKRPAPRA